MAAEARVPLKEADCNIENLKINVIQNKPDLIIASAHENQDNEKNGTFFRNILKMTRTQLTGECEIWNKILEENCDLLDEPTKGDIRTVIGQAHLVMKERGKQFEGLIDNHEFGTSEKTINSSDLQGFWDMIYFQVEDVNNKFQALFKKKNNDWKEEEVVIAPKPKVKKIKRTAVKNNDTESSKAKAEVLKAKRAAARKRLAAVKASMKSGNNNNAQSKSTFDAGFFKVESPVKKKQTPRVTRSDSPLTTRGMASGKKTTPSGNFMHGRVIRSRLASSTKRTLQFSDENNAQAILEPNVSRAAHHDPAAADVMTVKTGGDDFSKG